MNPTRTILPMLALLLACACRTDDASSRPRDDERPVAARAPARTEPAAPKQIAAPSAPAQAAAPAAPKRVAAPAARGAAAAPAAPGEVAAPAAPGEVAAPAAPGAAAPSKEPTPPAPSTAAKSPARAGSAADAASAARAKPDETAGAAHDRASDAPASNPMSGAVSEEEFKRMHTLRADAAPALRGETVEVGGTRAYLSLPENARPGGGAIVVIHEWWGLNDHVRHWADRLASAGYAALAVDLYEGVVAKTPDEAMAAMKKVDQERAVATMLAAHRFLAEDARVRASKTASIGWCFGGAMSLKLALAAPDLDACVMYYGKPETDARKLASLRAPLLGVFGNRDASIPPDVVDAFDRALSEAGKEHEILRYDAEHAFANPSGGRYDEKAASAAWREVEKFLAARIGGAR